jgi:uncharacterized membrane protein
MKSDTFELPLERVLFFSDAIVAIAITLLALELRLPVPDDQPLHYADLLKPWHLYLAFLLSFINISSFWNLHHRLFIYIRKMDDRLKLINTSWLFFIVTLPFASSVLSDHLSDSAAVTLYTLNVLLISLCQRLLWAYSVRHDYVDAPEVNDEYMGRINLFLNMDIVNALIALAISFFAPITAFILLFFKIPLMLTAFVYMASVRRKQADESAAGSGQIDQVSN